MSSRQGTVEGLTVAVYTPEPEADGTLRSTATTAVVVHSRSGEHTGLGWTYRCPAGHPVADVGAAWSAMHRATRTSAPRDW